MPDLSGKIATGAAWMLLARMLDRALGIVSTIILTRLLVPGDFGLVAMATAVWGLLELMGAFGFDVALIRDQKTSRDHFDTAWTITVIFGAFIAACMVALALPASWFYSEPRLETIMYCLAGVALLNSFGNVGIVLFRKDLDFRREFQYLFLRRLVAFFTTVPLAFLLRSHWALVAGIMAGGAGGVALSYWAHPYRPRFSLACLRELFGFSKWLFFTNLLFFLNQRSSDFILGRVSGSTALGIYNVSNELATLPTTEAVAPINRAVFPVYSKIASDLVALRAEFLRVYSMLVMLTFPAALGVAATAPMIVQVVLGPKWTEAGPVIQVLAIAGVLSASTQNNGIVYFALGRPKIPAVFLAGFNILMIPAVAAGALWAGPLGAAFAVLGVTIAGTPVNFAIAARLLSIRSTEYFARLWRPLVAGAAMYAVVAPLVEHWLPDAVGGAGIASLCAVVALGAALYVVGILVLWMACGQPGGPERYLLERARALLSRAIRRDSRPG